MCHPFFIAVFRASDIHDKTGDDAEWVHSLVMVSYYYPPVQPSSIVRTSYHCWASWGLKNLSPGTHSSTPSLPLPMEGRRISLLQWIMPASTDHTEISWQFGPWCHFHHLMAFCWAGLFICHLALWSAPNHSGKTISPGPGSFVFLRVMKLPAPENGHIVTHHPQDDSGLYRTIGTRLGPLPLPS